MYKAVIFDLDGTLLDTLTDLYNSVNHALQSFGFPLRSKDEVRSFIGNGVKKLMERSTPTGTDEKTDAKCLDCFRGHYLLHMRDNTAPYDGVEEILKTLREKGIKTAVVSNKLHMAVAGLCEEYFGTAVDKAIGVSEEAERKPNPINVLKVLEAFGVSKNECIYVGDSDVDVQTAHNAGLSCIGVTWGFRDEALLKAAGAEFIAHRAEDVLEIVIS